MKNGEILYKKLKLGEITKSQLTEQQKGDLYQYMVDSKKVTVDMIKPEVAQKYNLSVTPTPSRSPDTNAPIITPTYTPTHIPSRSPDTNAINYQPPKSTTPEMELVDILSNITIPTRGRTTQHERQQGSAYTPKPITQSTPTDLTLADRAEQGIKGIGYNWAGGNLSSIGTIASIGSDIEVNHRPESSFISPKDFYPNNPEYKDNRIAETLQLADKLLAKGSEHTAKGREGLGTAGGVAYDILTGAGQMGADIGTAAVTGVGMLPVLGTRVFGQSASEARQEGADIGQQIAYGAISAGIEIATEKLVGGLPMAEKLGMGGVADNTIKKLAQGIASSPRLAKAFTYIANMAGEGAEEMIAEILSPVAKKMTYDPNADWATIEEVLYSGLLGAGISGVMGGGVLLQGTPIETPTQTQSVMTNENIEPDIQGFQNTIDTGLNQLYSVLDSGQKNEQAINAMITNLEKVKQLVPVLSNYVDSHIVRLNNYKTIEQPQTNETNKVEQTIEQDTNVPQIGDKDFIGDIETLIKQGSYKYNGLPVRYNSKLKGEARNKTTYIEVGDKFFNLDSNQQINVLNHEVAHNNDLFDGKKFIEVMDGGIFGKPVTRRDGSVTWEGIFGDIGSNAVEETYTEALKVFRDDPEWLKEKHPKVYEYFTGERIVDDNKTIDNIIPIDELRQKEILQDSNNIVTETQQLDNVTTEQNESVTDVTESSNTEIISKPFGRNTFTIWVGENNQVSLGDFDTDEEAKSFYDKHKDRLAKYRPSNVIETDIEYAETSKEIDDLKKLLDNAKYVENEYAKYERTKSKPLSINDIITNLENNKYRRADMESLAEQASQSNWDDYEQLTDEELRTELLEAIKNYSDEMNPLERQYDKYGFSVRPVAQSATNNTETTPQATEQPTTTETKTAEQTVEEDKYIIKKGDYVKIDGIGIGKAVSDNSVEISGKRYYRDTEDTDYSKSTAAEYWQDLQKQIKELKNIAKEKRKEAADYNKETGGMATKRKGKISMGDGRGIGFAENSVSAHHRKLLSEAKEFSDKAKELESRIDERKKQLETRVRDGINLYDKDAEEAKILGVETKKKVDEKTDTDNKEETKETWQMTKEEFKNFAFSKGKTEDWWTPVGQTQHETYVRSALLDGKDIPQSVLNEYPNLKKEIEQTQKEIEVEKQKQAKYEETDRIAKELERQKSEITLDNFMDSVKEDDIDFKRAERAYSAVSFDPDKRAKSNQQEYVNTVKNTYEELLPLAKTDEQKTILLEEMIKFKENYLKKFNALLDATSRTMSAMITGPANFPTARNQKAMETENKRRNEFLDWLDKSVPAIKKKLNNALPETERNNETLNKLKKEVDDTIASLLAIKNGSPYNPAAFRNSLKGYFERNLKNGNIEEVRQASEYLKEQQKEKGITVFTSVNNIWKQIENAKSKKVITGENVVREYEGAKIVRNNDIDRIQIFFDEVPSQEIRNEMKKSGWHYSKANNNAWQRKITNNAEYNAKQIVEKYFKLIQPEMQEEVKVDETTNKQTYRYYLTQRPPAPGAIPRGSKNTVSFDTKQEVDGLEAWGYVEYDKPLTDEQISDYELSENVTETKQVDNIIGMETNINGWYVKVQNYNETYSEYKIIATKGNQSEAIFVEPKYLTDQNSLEREAKRFYNNRLVDLDEQNETISEVTTTDNNGSEKDIVTEEPISETKEEQIKETKEELQDRIDKLQETGTRGLSKNETKIYNLLISNKDTDIYTLMDKMLDIPRSNADGFDSQQRYVFVKKLIEGAVKQDTFNAVTTAETKNSKGNVIKEQGLKTVTADVVTIKIPNDGTFRISPDYASVSTIINRLGVKIKSQIPKGFNNVFSKETVMLGDDYYATGGIAVKADNVLLDEIKATHERVSNTNDDIRKMENLFNKFEKNAEWKEIKNNPYLTLHNIGGKKDKGYYIEVDNKTFLYNQKYIDYLNKDGNKFYVDTNSIGIIKVENTNSETIGIIMPISDNAKHDFTDGNMYQATKQNFWSNPKQGKTTEQIIDKDDIPPQFQGDTPQSEKDKVLGIVPLGFDITPTPITEKFTYNTPELERQYKNNRITKQGKISKFKELASEFKKAATRTHRELDVKNSDNAEILKELIRYPKIKSIAGDEATRILTDIVQRENKKLSKEEYSRFERFIFLSDLMEEIELGHELPGLWTEDPVRSNYEKLKQSLTPNIEEALERRKEYWNNIVKDYTEAMSEIGYDVSGRFTKENYFRHQVLEHVNAKQLAGSGGKAKVKTNRGYIKTRQGTQKAINEDYFQAEYEVLATMLYDKEVAQMLKRIDDNYGIKNNLMEQAKEKNAEIRENNKKSAMEAIKGNKELEDTYKELKGKEKADFIKQYAGDEYKEANFTWKDFIPDDYEIWQPIPGKHMFTVNTVSETFAEAIIQEALNELSPKDMRVGTALAIGQDKEQFVLPSRVAKSLDNTYNKLSSQDDIIHKILSYPMSLWKSWVLTVNPRQVVKYNLRNITGDIDGLMASAGIKAFNPKLVGKAAKELFNAMRYGKFTKDLLEFRNRGGYSDLMYAQELGEIYETKSFKIYNQADTNSILRNAIKKMPGLKTYTDFTENATNWRESILRYSAYLYFKEDLKKNNGKPTYYGASTRERIDGLKTIEDKAYQLSKDALGSYDEITEVGQALKKYLIPFHSWNEVNMKRYKRVFENTIADIKQQEEIGKQFLSGLGLLGYTSIHGTRLIGKMAIRVFFASALLMAWNRLVKPDDDDELPDDIKNTPHLTLGRDEKGNIIYFSRLGALNEVLDWFNLDQIIPDLKEIANERKTIEEQAKDMAIAPLNKIVNSISPFIKTPVELLSNSSYYPDIRHPGTIRDKNYYIFNSFGLGEEYRRFAGLPTETSYAESWQKALIYKSNPEVNAYYKAIDLKYKFEKNVLKQDTGRFLGGSEKSEALYYYKQALKYDDKKAANKYLKKYYELGGTDKGLKQSLASLNPLYGLVEHRGEREQFREWLTEDERKILDRAIKYYEDLIKQE